MNETPQDGTQEAISQSAISNQQSATSDNQMNNQSLTDIKRSHPTNEIKMGK